MFTTIIVGQEKQIPLFVDGAHAFLDQRHYVKLMGYDKPLNLRWEKSKFLFHNSNKYNPPDMPLGRYCGFYWYLKSFLLQMG